MDTVGWRVERPQSFRAADCMSTRSGLFTQGEIDFARESAERSAIGVER
jgi:hypothetical protein